MKRKFSIKKLFYNDRMLKVLSVVFAVIIWFIVVYVISPETTSTINNVPVSFDNASLEKLGLSVVEGQNATVNINVKGNRLTLSELTHDNFIARVSLVGVTEAGTYEQEVQIAKKYQNTDYEVIPPTRPIMMKVKFDRYASKKMQLSVDLSGVATPEGYIMEKSYITPGEISISGPEAEVSRISKCVVEAQLPDTLDKTFIVSGDIVLYDLMGGVIDTTNIKMDKDKADVTIPVLKKKTLPVSVEFSNIPRDFPLEEIKYTLSASSIEVAGPAETIDTMSKISIGYLDLKSLEPDSVFVFDVQLPDGFVNIGGITNVKVDFAVSDFGVKSFKVREFSLKNVPDTYAVTVATKSISNVRLVGPQDVLDLLLSGDIIGEIDLDEWDLGTSTQYNVPVQIVVPSRGAVWAIGDYTAVITAKLK